VNFSDLLYLRFGGCIDVFCCSPPPCQPHPEPLGLFFTDSELREGPGELKEHGDPHLVAIPRQKPPHDTVGGDRTPSLPSRYGEVPALPPSPAGAPRFVGADAGGPHWAHTTRTLVSLGRQGQSRPLGGPLWSFGLASAVGRRTTEALNSGRIRPSSR
jgi:hypothetical protein